MLSLGLGIGANTAIFSLTNSLILKSLPVRRPGELVQLNMPDRGKTPANSGSFEGFAGKSFTNPLWEAIRDRATGFAGLIAYGSADFNLASGGVARHAAGAWVNGDFFYTLGVSAVAGRVFQRADDERGCPGIVDVSPAFAQREYGSMARAVGSTVSLNGHPFEIAGVIDERFHGITVGENVEVYAPICAQEVTSGPGVLDVRGRWYLYIMGRRAAGVTDEQVRTSLAALAPGALAATLPPDWSAEQQSSYLKTTFSMEPAPTGISGLRQQYAHALYLLMIVVGAVLLIACANIANLLLARAASRQHEIAIRLAIGAGRRRVLRQMLTESVVLTVLGGIAGVFFARWAAAAIIGFLTAQGQAVWLDLTIDWRVAAFTIAAAMVTAMLFGIAPAWRASRVDPEITMRSRGRGVAGGSARHRTGRILVVGQIALSVALVSVAGLLLTSFVKLSTIDPGFRRDGILLVHMNLANTGFDSPHRYAAQRQLLEQVRTLPGVDAASGSAITPVSQTSWNDFIVVPGYEPPSRNDALAWFNQVSDGYFATMGTPLLGGRDISRSDGPGTARVAVINMAMARKFFGGGMPVGRSFRTRIGRETSEAIAVVGVVGDAKYASLTENPVPTVYLPLGQGDDFFNRSLNVEIRTSASASSLKPLVTSATADVSGAISLEFKALSDQLSASIVRPRLLATLSAFFGALALLLAVIGLYGTISYAVTQRRNELGIRMALGAAGPRLVRLVLGDAARLVLVGLFIGAGLTWMGTRLVRSFVFGVAPDDPTVLTLSAILLGVIAIAAALVPALRAARLDPTEALRQE